MAVMICMAYFSTRSFIGCSNNMLRPFISSMVLLTVLWFVSGAHAAPYATDWVAGHTSRTRLIVGAVPKADGRVQRYAAFEVVLSPGWKTYWRQTGPAGGIPPYMSTQGSKNLKSAALQFPAPLRMVDPSGETIGYKKSVILPIAIEPVNRARPVALNLKLFFGVCREICIPAEAAFKVTLAPEMFRQTPPELTKALAKLPAKAGQPAAGAGPQLRSVKSAAIGGGKRALTFDVRFSKGTAGADLFAETGSWEPLEMSTVIARPSSKTIRYQVIVVDGGQWQSLAKTGLHITIVSDAGASEARVPRP
jgi:DsbC/DsbD-like thiol-disulfide interchange protein